MKLQIVSDLHLEFCPITIKNAGSDVLVLSGDICVADYFKRSEASPYFAKAEAFRAFFKQVSEEFDLVLYVLGNHEHYSGDFERTAVLVQQELPSNVVLLNNAHMDWKGFRFIGGTLWTDFNKNDPIATMSVEQALNDYHVIKRINRKLRGYDTYREHKKFLEYVDAHIVPNTIVLGHHGPSWKSVSPEYSGKSHFYLNAGYVSDLGDFILNRPDIKLWTHGHVHSSHDYMIGDTRIFANPRGYQRNPDLPAENRNFDPNLIVTI